MNTIQNSSNKKFHKNEGKTIFTNDISIKLEKSSSRREVYKNFKETRRQRNDKIVKYKKRNTDSWKERSIKQKFSWNKLVSRAVSRITLFVRYMYERNIIRTEKWR